MFSKRLWKNSKLFCQTSTKILSWNPGRESLEQGCQTYADLIPVVDVLLINQEEAQLFTGEKELEGMFQTFSQFGFQGMLLLRMECMAQPDGTEKSCIFVPSMKDSIAWIRWGQETVL